MSRAHAHTHAKPWLLALLLGACQAEPEPVPEPAPTRPQVAVERPAIELAGCRHVEVGRCWLRAGTDEVLRVWIDAQARAPLQVTIDGVPVEAQRAAVDGGQQLRVTVPASAERLRIEGVQPPWTEAFELSFDREQIPAVVAEARRLGREGNTAAGIEMLRDALPQLEGADRLAALQVLRRLLFSVEPDEALRQTEAAAELARALGRTGDFGDCAAAVIFMVSDRGDLVAARRWAQELETIAIGLPEARVLARYNSGVLASRIGDLNQSIRAFEDARRLARRLGMTRDLLEIDEQLAITLAELGRGDEALLVAREILDHIDQPEVRCGDRGRALGNVAWTNMLLAEGGHAHDAPRELLEQQLELVGEGEECPDPSNAALVNLAILALAENEPDEAWGWVRAQRELGVPSYLELWVDEVEAQIGIATGNEELVPELVRRPDPGGGDPGLRWVAIVRHAQTLDALGLHDAAIDVYLEAEAVLEATFQSVGVSIGRERFLAGRRASSEGLVELLVRQGDIDAAFCRARLARGRALRTIDREARIAGLSAEQRDRRDELLYGFLTMQEELAADRRADWKFSAPEREHRERRRAERAAEATQMLDEALRLVGGGDEPSGCDQLPALPPNVVTILQFPRPEGGSWIFVADAQHTSVHEASDPSASAWSSEILAPFAEQIAAAQQLRIMPTGSGWSVPFHALPFGDGVLLDVAPVVYALDLPARELRSHAREGALVVANPSEDLADAAAEAEQVASRLTNAGWTVTHHVAAEATRAQLTDALGRVALLHYAGHGTHGGIDGWGAALLLHGGDRLEVSDVLALPQVPGAVVLSGCETATVDVDTVAGGMNLSRAFVLAGAQWVIAADGKVDDDLARAMGVALYEDALPTHAFDGADALRRAQLRLREQHPERWHAFRVVVP